MADMSMPVSPDEAEMILALRTEKVAHLRARMRRLRQILKPMCKRDRKIWTAKYRCGLLVFLQPQL